MSEAKKTVKKKKKWGKVYEYTPTIRASVLTEELAKDIEAELKKSNATTPQALAKKFQIKVSLAKKILNSQVDSGEFNLSTSTRRNQIYSK